MKIVLNILLNKNYELCVLGYGIQRITIIFFYQYLDSEVSITSFFLVRLQEHSSSGKRGGGGGGGFCLSGCIS